MSNKSNAAAQEAQTAGAIGPVEEAKPAGTGHKTVPVRLFRDNERYKDDVFVAVNGQSFLVKRGETVMVPDFVAEVLERSMAQDQSTAKLIETKSGEFAAEAERRGL